MLVYKDIVSRYSDMVHDMREGATGRRQCLSDPVTGTRPSGPTRRVQIRLQLDSELASPITVVLDSLYALTVCALLRWSLLEVYMGRVIVAYGHPSGASQTVP